MASQLQPQSQQPLAQGGGSTRRFGLEDFMWGSTLGEGSYARVVHAQLKSNGRHYAIKVMEKRHIRRENKVKQVLTEKHVLSRVAHEFVVKLWFTFQDTENLYLVLDLATGGELLSVIHHHKERALAAGLGPQRACPWEVSRFYLGEVSLALEYLHGEGVVHRDLKPQNVLISQQGHVKLTDFGSALCLSADAPQGPMPAPPRQSSSSGSGSTEGEEGEDEENRPHCSFVGTAEYVSPEVLANEPATPGVDMWAVGCMTFELLVGEPPFRGRSDYLTFQDIMAHCNGSKPLEYPAHLEAECPQAVDLIRRLLVRDPRKRLGAVLPSPPPPPPPLAGGGGSGAVSYSYSYSYSYSQSCSSVGGEAQEGGGAEEDGGSLRVHPFFEGFGWERVLSEPPPYMPPVERAATLLGERMRDGLLEREDWLGLGIGFEEEGVPEAVPLAPMASFTGGVMMRPASLRRDSEAGEEEEEEGEEEGVAAPGLAAAEAALREAAEAEAEPAAAEGLTYPRTRTWDRFMDAAAGERCAFTNLVWKRSGLVARRRQLALTSLGRLLYICPKTFVVKGTIAGEGLRIEPRGEHAFDLVTPQRVHHFTDYEVGAARWATAIREALGQGQPPPPPLPPPTCHSKGVGRRSPSPNPSPSSSPVRMLPAALAMLGLGTGAGGSPHGAAEPPT